MHYGNNISAHNYADNILMHGSRGHGFAAEKANDLYDRLTGKDAKIVGNDFAKNGADRLVNGIEIQTKYCKTGARCIRECFENGKFRYMGSNGKPMKIEVPKDKFEEAIKAMEQRIKRGQVPGITDPNEAKHIVKKGKFTYVQAENVAKFGKIESIAYDAIRGIEVFSITFGISSIITFACAIWNGEKIEDAIKQAFNVGIKVGGMGWATSIITAQIGRTSIEQSLRPVTDYIVKSLNPSTTADIANSLRLMANKEATKIYGAAAANNLSKVLRGNIVTGAITTAILSIGDVNRLVKGEISGKQAFKNVTVTSSSVLGGGIGMTGGAQIGAMVGSVIPGPGTVIGAGVGGLVGGMTGGMLTSKTVKSGLDKVIDEDSKKMLEIFQDELAKIAFNYVLNIGEIEKVIEEIRKKGIEKILRQMHGTKLKEKYAESIIMEQVLEVIKVRKKVKIEM